MTRNSIRGRLVTLFSRHGVEGQFTKLFSNLSDGQRDSILSHVALEAGEIPALAHYVDQNAWTLVTTDHVYWRNRREAGRIEASDITSVGEDLFRAARPAMESRLDLKLRDNHKAIVLFEPGGPMNGVWNALRFFAKRNGRTTN
jgi:hypothetical protein